MKHAHEEFLGSEDWNLIEDARSGLCTVPVAKEHGRRPLQGEQRREDFHPAASKHYSGTV
jgi:hypothetical protein